MKGSFMNVQLTIKEFLIFEALAKKRAVNGDVIKEKAEQEMTASMNQINDADYILDFDHEYAKADSILDESIIVDFPSPSSFDRYTIRAWPKTLHEVPWSYILLQTMTNRPRSWSPRAKEYNATAEIEYIDTNILFRD